LGLLQKAQPKGREESRSAEYQPYRERIDVTAIAGAEDVQ